MNIYDYFHSPDIAEHCKKIGHVFSPLDMAVIIAKSGKPKETKHSAWREIIQCCPDMSIHESMNFKARGSLHDHLKELIAREEKHIAAFYTPQEGAVYHYSMKHTISFGRCESIQDEHRFSSVENALCAAQNWLKEAENDDIIGFSIQKMSIDSFTDGYELHDYAYFDINANLCDIYCASPDNAAHVKDDLNMIFIDIPVPFEKGDLVELEGMPYVLNWLPHWAAGKRSYSDYVSGRRGDGSDMNAHCYSIDRDGHLTNDDYWNFFKLGFYRGELKDQNRFLKYLSRYIKSGDESVDWLINVFIKIKAEADIEKHSIFFSSNYIPIEQEETRTWGRAEKRELMDGSAHHECFVEQK